MVMTVCVNASIAMQFLQGKWQLGDLRERPVPEGVKLTFVNQQISDDTHHLLLSAADLM
jgi:hypothetical protein